PQPEAVIINILRNMGGEIKQGRDEVLVRDTPLEGIKVSLRDSPDLLPVISALAVKAKNETVITDVGHARFKESDRISVIATEFRKAGIKTEELPEGLRILPGELKPAVLDPHGDHRLFMAFSLLSIYSGGKVLVKDPECVAVSYPQFLNDLKTIGCRVEIIE
ncbi:MAG: 3-phosphoshikimate 1-carboxyvinyltransferase, partial [Nitrososphaerota archaeon]